jgi:predicted CXXCH cytochrome family protein
MGCTACHNPHSTPAGRLLKAEGNDLCFTCHDKAQFGKKVVHAAIGMGCTGCHVPHSSRNERLLIAAVPDVCMTCHDKTEFSKINVHPPVASGMCLSCHSPHSTDQVAMLHKTPSELCVDCHENVPKALHAITGFTKSGHPLGLPRRSKTGTLRAGQKTLMDPLRQERPFSCASCHNPHSSDYRRLFRYAAENTMQLCKLCHKK